MAQVVITIKVMPEDPRINLDLIKDKATEIIAQFKGEVGKVEIQPVAFGLNALMLYFIRDESLGDTEEIEKKIKELPGVNSVQVTDVRRTIG